MPLMGDARTTQSGNLPKDTDLTSSFTTTEAETVTVDEGADEGADAGADEGADAELMFKNYRLCYRAPA